MKLGNIIPRRDGKFKVTIIYDGGPNMFGGSYPPKVFRKIVGQSQLDTLKAQELVYGRARYDFGQQQYGASVKR